VSTTPHGHLTQRDVEAGHSTPKTRSALVALARLECLGLARVLRIGLLGLIEHCGVRAATE
jgi:hypothetical protein